MRKVRVLVNGEPAGILSEIQKGKSYEFEYDQNYRGEPVSLIMPLKQKKFNYERFPPFFDGLLPEGVQLEALLKIGKIDADDYFQQLIKVGHDMVGNVTVEEME